MKYPVLIALTFLIFIVSIPHVISSPNRWEGTPLVKFSLMDQHGKIRNNQNFKGNWLVLYFYPKDKTPGCTLEAQQFTKDYQKFKKLGVEIVGVSLDDVASHKDFSDTYQMPFILLSDSEAQLSKALDVYSYFPWPHASRQTFLINPEGIIAKHIESVTPKTHSAELLKLINHYKQSKK